MQKAQTQNVSHMTETAQAKTARDFLRGGRANWTNWQTANEGISLKIGEVRAQAKSLIRWSGNDITRQHLKEKTKALMNTDLSHCRMWINY